MPQFDVGNSDALEFGHLMADLDPLRWKEPLTPRELDPATYGLTIWDLDREFLTDGVGGTDKLPLGTLLGVLRDAYCRTVGGGGFVSVAPATAPAGTRFVMASHSN